MIAAALGGAWLADRGICNRRQNGGYQLATKKAPAGMGVPAGANI